MLPESADDKKKMNDDEGFFTDTDIEALTKLYAPEAESPLRKKVKLLRKVPMLLPEESKPLNTILICRHPEERILIVKEPADFENRKKPKKIPEQHRIDLLSPDLPPAEAEQ
jgi:hypothetical protein